MKKNNHKLKKKKQRNRNSVSKNQKSESTKSLHQKPIKPKVETKMNGKAIGGKVAADSSKKYFNRAFVFLKEAKMELKKVKWPTRKELITATSVVIVLTLIVAFYLGIIDFLLIKIIRLIVG